MKIIFENDRAIIWEVNEHNFEIWIKLFYTVGTWKGELIRPNDEDFGVKAWSTTSRERALMIYGEITSGERTIRPMVESV